MKKQHLFITLIAFLLSYGAQAAPFSGSYTVGTGETYTTLTEIWNALVDSTISGPVTIKLKSGFYEGNNQLWNVEGLSADNQVIIESQTGNSNDVILESGGGWTIHVYGNHITFKNLTINQPNASQAIYTQGSAEHIVFENLIVNGYDNQSSSNRNSCFYINGSSDISIKNCTVNGGSYLVYGRGDVDRISLENVTSNTVVGFLSSSSQGVSITDCTIKSTFRGLSLVNASDVDIHNNKFLTGTRLELNTITSLNFQNTFYNNVVESESQGALRVYQCDMDLHHNTLINKDYQYVIDLSRNGVVNVKNNLFIATDCGGFIQSYDLDTKMNYGINGYGTSDANCQVARVQASTTDLHYLHYSLGLAHPIVGGSGYDSTSFVPITGLFNSKGESIDGLTTDLNGNTRGTNPDLGAIEYSPALTNDLAIRERTSQQLPICDIASDKDIKVLVENVGTNPITSAEFAYVAGNATNAPIEYSFTGNIAPGATAEVNLGTFEFTGYLDFLSIYLKSVNGGTDSDSGTNLLADVFISEAVSGRIEIGEDSSLLDFFPYSQRLRTGGICGDVTFAINPGVYTRGYYSGMDVFYTKSEDDKLTFTSTTENAQDVVLAYAPESSNNIYIDGNVHVEIRNLTLSNRHNSRGANIYSNEGVKSMTLKNLILYADSTNSRNDINIGNTRKIVVDKCTTYGGKGPYFRDSYGDVSIRNSSFNDYTSLVYISNSKSAEILNSTFKCAHTENAINIGNTDRITIQNNEIIVDTLTGIGLAIETSGQSTALINNNYFYTKNGDAESIIYLEEMAEVSLLNNTIRNESCKFSQAAVYITNAGLIELKNNILHDNLGENYLIQDYNTKVWQTGFNNYYSPIEIRFISTQSGTQNLAQWTQRLNEVRSISEDPMFSTSSMHICNPKLNNAGTNTDYLTKDIDGDIRKAGKVDIGADQFTTAEEKRFITTNEVSLCDGAATLNAAANANSYIWNTGATTRSIEVTEEGTYSVTIDGYCGTSGSDSATVVDEELTVSFYEGEVEGTLMNFIPVITGKPHTYRWDFGDGNYSSEENARHIYDATGIYEVKLTVTSDCGTRTYSKEVSLFNLSIGELDLDIRVYPNPTHDKLTIKTTNEAGFINMKLLNPIGQIALQNNNLPTNSTLDLSALPNGIYYLEVQIEGTVLKKKIYKN